MLKAEAVAVDPKNDGRVHQHQGLAMIVVVAVVAAKDPALVVVVVEVPLALLSPTFMYTNVEIKIRPINNKTAANR